jgi:uncharacterized membrane protein YqjE
MESVTDTLPGLGVCAKQLARRLLVIGDNRLELAMVEMQEERKRFLRAIQLGLGVGVFGFLAGITLSAALVVWAPVSPGIVLLVLTALYTGAAILLYRRLTVMQRAWKTFPATLDQLRKDRACLQTLLQ